MIKKSKFKPFDVVLILSCVAAIVFLFYRVKATFVSSIDLLDIGRYLFRRDPETGKWVANFLVLGVIATIKISIWAMIPASIAGVVFGIFRTSSSRFLRMVGRTYVELVRNLPPLVLIYIFYFFVADQVMTLIGVEEFARSLSESAKSVLSLFFAEAHIIVQYFSGVLTLAFFVGAYITEIVRAGIESVGTGQRQAAYSLGLSWLDEMRFIILPQAIKVVVPALASEYINVVKYSSILSVVSIQEMTFMGQQVILLNSDMLGTWLSVAVIYLLLTSTLSFGANRLEVRMARSN